MRIGKKTFGLVAAATGVLLITGGAPAIGSPHMKAALIATPHLTVTAGKGQPFQVKGPRQFPAGRVNVTLHAHKGEQEVGFMRLHPGYSYADAGHDFGIYAQAEDDPTPDAIAAINRLVKHVTFYGGIDSGTGHATVNGSVVLPKAGNYLAIDDEEGPGAGKAVKLHVTDRAGSRTVPVSTATVKATNAKRFAGDVNLPADGTVEFKNVATNSPHFFFLQHMKTGITRKEALKAFQSGPPGAGPGPFRQGGVGTDVLYPGKSQTLTYSLPKGDYAVLCFFPDLKTGMPHLFMGMIRILHLS